MTLFYVSGTIAAISVVISFIAWMGFFPRYQLALEDAADAQVFTAYFVFALALVATVVV